MNVMEWIQYTSAPLQAEAICYEYDFTYIARRFGKLDADIIALPSPYWRGNDPLHSRWVAFRAIEQGHLILSSTRFGNSAALTSYGEMIGQMSSFDNNNKIMIAYLPVKSITTYYSLIGDGFIFFCIGLVIFLFVYLFSQGFISKT